MVEEEAGLRDRERVEMTLSSRRVVSVAYFLGHCGQNDPADFWAYMNRMELGSSTWYVEPEPREATIWGWQEVSVFYHGRRGE